MDKELEILKPFDPAVQTFLKFVEEGCQRQAELIKAEDTRAELAGDSIEVTPEIAAWRAIIRAYGVLYNRSVDAGWIDDVMIVEGR